MIQQIFIEIFVTLFFGIFLYFYTSWALMYPQIIKFIKRHNYLHPNAVTLYRIPLAILAFYLYYKGVYFPAVVIYMAAIVTDAIDGKIARSCHLSTELGKSLDPLVDKIVYFLPLLYFGFTDIVPFSLVCMFILIDILGQFSRVVLKFFQMPTQANIFGKLKTCLVFIFIYYLMIIGRRYGELFYGMNDIILWCIICFAFLSIFFKFISIHDIFGFKKDNEV